MEIRQSCRRNVIGLGLNHPPRRGLCHGFVPRLVVMSRHQKDIAHKIAPRLHPGAKERTWRGSIQTPVQQSDTHRVLQYAEWLAKQGEFLTEELGLRLEENEAFVKRAQENLKQAEFLTEELRLRLKENRLLIKQHKKIKTESVAVLPRGGVSWNRTDGEFKP